MNERDKEYRSGDALLIKILESAEKNNINLVNKENGKYFINQE